MRLRHRAFISLTVLGLALMAANPGWSATTKAQAEPELRTASQKKAVAKPAAKPVVKTTVTKTTTKGKATQVAATTPAKKTAPAPARPAAKVAARPVVQKPSAKPVTPPAKPAGNFATNGLAAVTRAVTALPQAIFPKAEPKLNAAPVPYQAVAGQGTPVAPTPLNAALAPYDAVLYQSAFDLIDAGDYTGADAQLAQVADQRLMGYAQYHKLFSRDYTSTYEELTGWLDVYGDHPMAMRVWNLAKRKKPDGAPDPAFPRLAGAQASLPSGTGVQLAGSTSLSGSTSIARADAAAPASDTSLTPKSARSAYNNGQLDQAVSLGRKIGDHWVAGLACWRLKRYEDALAEFKFVGSDPSSNAWTQSSGAYWAGRSALRLGREDEARSYFELAASFPFTFYGLVAEERLGVTPAVSLAQKGLPPTYGRDQRGVLSASLTSDFTWTQNNPRAQRLNALVQIGRNSEAQQELQAAIQGSAGAEERDRWLAFGARTHVPYNQLKPTDSLFDVSLYPLPDIAPKGGYTVDKALIFAIARKESKFDAKAHSYSGAYGLLQLMPATAALVENDPSFNSKPNQLLTPAVNLRVGQNYITRLQGSSIVDSDLLRTIAAYNAGPRPVKDATDSLGDDADSLLVMESIPVAQTRQYVEEVVANYWIYRQIMGKPSKTLAMAAHDAKIIDITADAPEAATKVAMSGAK